jgi:hypothetical protein
MGKLNAVQVEEYFAVHSAVSHSRASTTLLASGHLGLYHAWFRGIEQYRSMPCKNDVMLLKNSQGKPRWSSFFPLLKLVSGTAPLSGGCYYGVGWRDFQEPHHSL